MYCEETLSLGKLSEIVGQYHDKEALTLEPEGQVNNIRADSRSAGSATRRVIFQKIFIAHVITSVENATKSAILRCVARVNRQKKITLNRDSCRFRGNTGGKPKHGRMARSLTGQRYVRQVTEQTMDESRENKDDFYVFSARSREAQNTVDMLLEDQPINVTIDSGANCNLMSERVFEHSSKKTLNDEDDRMTVLESQLSAKFLAHFSAVSYFSVKVLLRQNFDVVYHKESFISAHKGRL